MEKVKKERKKLKKGAVIAIVLVAVIVALSGAGLLWYFWDMIFNPPENSDLGQYYGLFGYAPDTEEETSYADYSDRFATFSTEIERGIAEEATDEEKVLAAYIIYRIACLANETATMKAKYTIGTGSASGAIVAGEEGTPVEVGCSMNLTASYYTLLSPFPATPSIEEINSGNYEKYEVSEEYTQIPAGAVTATNETFAKIGEPVLRIVLPFARRGILTPTNKIVWEGDQDSSVITPTGVTGKFAVKDSKFKKMTSEDMIESGVSREYPLDWGDEYGLSKR